MEWLNVRDLMARYGFSRAHIYNLIKAGILPRGVRFGRSVRWRLIDLQAAEERLLGASQVAP